VPSPYLIGISYPNDSVDDGKYPQIGDNVSRDLWYVGRPEETTDYGMCEQEKEAHVPDPLMPAHAVCS
jgi:hypothetical protein